MRVLWIMVAALLVASASEAQTDPLVGKWTGELQFQSSKEDPNRTLAIESVVEDIAYGWYGITGKNLGRVTIKIDRSGARPSISFLTGSNNPVRLNLMDETSLVGVLTLSDVREGSPNRNLTLRKVK